MSDPLGPQDDGNTPLDPEEREGLIPSYISLRSELNAAEQENINDAAVWASRRTRDVLDESFLQALHKRMLGRVWQWVGNYRRSGKNVGVDAYRIPTEVRQLLDDCRYWIAQQTYDPDEIAVRFHHRLVSIHCYPNGNGRHARLATDLLLRSLGREAFTWGRLSLAYRNEARERYLAALRAADAHDIGPLLAFVRS